MSHTLIIGMSESGKTSLAKQIAANMRARNIRTMALDPLRDPAWPVDFITADQHEFLRTFWASKKCAAFMDEGGQSVGRYNLAMQETVTKGRHWGHACYLIAQKATQLAPVVRDMCSTLFVFSVAPSSAKMLAEDFNNDLILQASTLKQFEFICVHKFGRAYRGKVNIHGKSTDDDRGGSVRSRGADEGEREAEEGAGHGSDGDSNSATGGGSQAGG
jgi:hypothetical protein